MHSTGHPIVVVNSLTDFERFVERLRELLRAELPQSVTRYDGLYDELGFDSFQAFELLIVVESLAGTVMPPPELPEIYTLGDAYTYYQQLRAGDTGAVGR